MRALTVVAVVGIALITVGCQTTGSNGISSLTGGSGNGYTIFFDQGDDLSEKVEAKDWAGARSIFNAHVSYFQKNRDDAEVMTAARQLADNEVARLRPNAVSVTQSLSSVKAPIQQAQWAEVKNKIDGARNVRTEIAYSPVLKFFDRKPSELAKIDAELERITTLLKAGAGDAFGGYPVFVEADFFEKYPAEVDQVDTIRAASGAIVSRAERRSWRDVATFLKAYGESMDERTRKLFASVALSSRIGGKPDNLKAVIAAIRDVRAAGIDVGELENPKIGFIEVTSQTLLNEGQIEFPPAVEVDLPFPFQKASLDEALSDRQLKKFDYLVVLDVAVARTTRRVANQRPIESQYQSASKTERNPAYTRAQLDVQQAQQLQMQAKMQSAQGCPGCGLVPALLVAAVNAERENTADTAYQSAASRLTSTPETIEVPIYSDYRFNVANVQARKTLDMNYYVIDTGKRTMFKSTVTVEEREAFEIAYQLHDKDKNRKKHAASYNSEADATEWEKKPVSMQLSAILDHYVSKSGSARVLPALATLRKQMLADKNTALAAYKKQKFDARPLNDARFDSVVVVYNPEGKIGAGFFVAPDLVLTNYHVVEETQFMELKLYNGQETFGKVVKTDIRMDLALIRVQTRGKPVSFYDSNSLDLGATTEAIGHPKGLTFSVSRGVVSALRNLPSAQAPGGKDLLFIQTDAAINPGNSGGPLFLGNKVIGVNTQKLAQVDVEGLGFALHHSEVASFLAGEF